MSCHFTHAPHPIVLHMILLGYVLSNTPSLELLQSGTLRNTPLFLPLLLCSWLSSSSLFIRMKDLRSFSLVDIWQSLISLTIFTSGVHEGARVKSSWTIPFSFIGSWILYSWSLWKTLPQNVQRPRKNLSYWPCSMILSMHNQGICTELFSMLLILVLPILISWQHTMLPMA